MKIGRTALTAIALTGALATAVAPTAFAHTPIANTPQDPTGTVWVVSQQELADIVGTLYRDQGLPEGMKVTVLVFDQPTDVYYNLAGRNESYVTKQMGFIGVEGETSSLKDGQHATLHTLQCNHTTGTGFYGGVACSTTQTGDYFSMQ